MEKQLLLSDLMNYIKDYPDRSFVKFVGSCLVNADVTKSQNFQDIWALHESKFKRGGFFIEFGAADGVNGSNTYLLEREYGWKGILIEPNPDCKDSLFSNRNCRIILDRCISTNSGEELEFLVTDEPDLSTIKGYGENDEHAEKRKNAKSIKSLSLSLIDLLIQESPKDIDYLSIDTEGSELDILTTFFNDKKSKRFNIKSISVEHNFNPQTRSALYVLLVKNGYRNVFREISRWDDFYVKEN